MILSTRIKNMIENAACASQNRTLEEDVTAEAIARNVAYQSFKEGFELGQVTPNAKPVFMAKLFINDGT